MAGKTQSPTCAANSTKARGHGTREKWRSRSADSGHATARGKPFRANHTTKRLHPGLVGQAVFTRWLDDFPQGAGAWKSQKSTVDCLEYRPVAR
jgi:hypothetical protein